MKKPPTFWDWGGRKLQYMFDKETQLGTAPKCCLVLFLTRGCAMTMVLDPQAKYIRWKRLHSNMLFLYENMCYIKHVFFYDACSNNDLWHNEEFFVRILYLHCTATQMLLSFTLMFAEGSHKIASPHTCFSAQTRKPHNSHDSIANNFSSLHLCPLRGNTSKGQWEGWLSGCCVLFVLLGPFTLEFSYLELNHLSIKWYHQIPLWRQCLE